uniref:Uncharacterized protein n=2 Tax=Picea TaxID=3328 RepID=A0A101LTY0_PICGL|nr:hypothetical protein ABT39_MTgene3468 [Picea glauca]QHR89685.1 hypothetical protein Q903MT_gene3707 [Picea sitchensis]
MKQTGWLAGLDPLLAACWENNPRQQAGRKRTTNVHAYLRASCLAKFVCLGESRRWPPEGQRKMMCCGI